MKIRGTKSKGVESEKEVFVQRVKCQGMCFYRLRKEVKKATCGSEKGK